MVPTSMTDVACVAKRLSRAISALDEWPARQMAHQRGRWGCSSPSLIHLWLTICLSHVHDPCPSSTSMWEEKAKDGPKTDQCDTDRCLTLHHLSLPKRKTRDSSDNLTTVCQTYVSKD